MRELTKEQRHEVYKQCMAELLLCEQEKRTAYLCCLLSELTPDMIQFCGFYYPEFWNKKPEHNYMGAWFPRLDGYCFDYESRKKILTACINETKP